MTSHPLAYVMSSTSHIAGAFIACGSDMFVALIATSYQDRRRVLGSTRQHAHDVDGRRHREHVDELLGEDPGEQRRRLSVGLVSRASLAQTPTGTLGVSSRMSHDPRQRFTDSSGAPARDFRLSASALAASSHSAPSSTRGAAPNSSRDVSRPFRRVTTVNSRARPTPGTVCSSGPGSRWDNT